MTKTFDFIFDAWKNQELLAQLIDRMALDTDSRLHTDIHTICFHADIQKADIFPLSDSSPFHCKISPVRITYSALKRMLNGDLEHFEEGDSSAIS